VTGPSMGVGTGAVGSPAGAPTGGIGPGSSQMGTPSQNVAGATLGLGNTGVLGTLAQGNPTTGQVAVSPLAPLAATISQTIAQTLTPALLAKLSGVNAMGLGLGGAGLGTANVGQQPGQTMGFPAQSGVSPGLGGFGGSPASPGPSPGVSAAPGGLGSVAANSQSPSVASPQAIQAAMLGMTGNPAAPTVSTLAAPSPPAVTNPASPAVQAPAQSPFGQNPGQTLGSIMAASPALAALFGGGNQQQGGSGL